MKTAKETVENFLEKLDQFTNETNTKFATFREEFMLAADMDIEQIKKLNKEELFDYAYALYSYASYIQDQINRQKVVFNLCNDQLQKMVAKYNEKFNPYTKYEMRMQMIVVDNEYAASIDNYKQVAEARIQELEGKVYELKRKGDILMEKGKRI